MAGEIALKKLYGDIAGAYVIDDFNEAQRNYFMSKNLIVIPAILTTTVLSSPLFELSGRTHFTIEVSNSGLSAGTFVLQGSVTGQKWVDITSTSIAYNATAPVTVSSEFPFRFYRIFGSNVASASSTGYITVYLAAIAK